MNNDVYIKKIEEENENLKSQLEHFKSQAAELEALVRYYEEQFRITKAQQFGRSSEKSSLESQLGLFDEVENTADRKLPEPVVEEVTRTRKELDAPTEKVEYSLEDTSCPECGEQLHVMSQDVRKEIRIIPAKVVVIEHVQNVYSCRSCEKNGISTPITKASAPEALIRGSLASSSGVAHIMVQKYVNAVPLYRQEQGFLQAGISLSRQTMSNWLIRCTQDYLKPLYELMCEELRKREVLHADETVLEVLKEPGRKANTNSYMWLYRTSGDTDKPIVLYEYQQTRSSSHPKRFLSGFKGYLHTDGYSGYEVLPVKIIGCYAHVRRYFDEALKGLPSDKRAGSAATIGLEYINKLFILEREYQKLPNEERYQRRLEKSLPIAEELFSWSEKVQALPKSALGKAIVYLQNQKSHLMNFFLDGRLELSNNRAERSIKPFVIGRKNWLFSNTPKGAETSAIIYSIIESAKENNLKPYDYLEYLLNHIPRLPLSELEKLLPWGDIPDICRLK